MSATGNSTEVEAENENDCCCCFHSEIPLLIYFFKIIKCQTGETVQPLWASIRFSAHICWLAIICNSSSGESDALFCSEGTKHTWCSQYYCYILSLQLNSFIDFYNYIVLSKWGSSYCVWCVFCVCSCVCTCVWVYVYMESEVHVEYRFQLHSSVVFETRLLTEPWTHQVSQQTPPLTVWLPVYGESFMLQVFFPVK